jgi:hypothetical protein
LSCGSCLAERDHGDKSTRSAARSGDGTSVGPRNWKGLPAHRPGVTSRGLLPGTVTTIRTCTQAGRRRGLLQHSFSSLWRGRGPTAETPLSAIVHSGRRQQTPAPDGRYVQGRRGLTQLVSSEIRWAASGEPRPEAGSQPGPAE